MVLGELSRSKRDHDNHNGMPGYRLLSIDSVILWSNCRYRGLLKVVRL